MLKINKDQMRLPLGGHHYYEDGLSLKGDTFEEVREKLSDFRLNNNRPVGNPGQDILIYYAVNFPYMVREDETEIPQETKVFTRWRAWVQKTWTHPPKKTLTTKEASFRWDVCKTCPHNLPIISGLKHSEFEQITRKAFMLRRGAKIPQELGYCSLHHFDLGVATFIETPKDHSERRKDTPDYPSCWV
jgi:hypothetical protein